MTHRRKSGVFRTSSDMKVFPVKIIKPGKEDKIYNPPNVSQLMSPTFNKKNEKDKKWIKHEGKWVKS